MKKRSKLSTPPLTIKKLLEIHAHVETLKIEPRKDGLYEFRFDARTAARIFKKIKASRGWRETQKKFRFSSPVRFREECS